MCGRCQKPATADETRCSACQSWLRGNTGALTHGGRRRPVTLETARNSPLYQELVTERGGEDAISAVAREVIVAFVEGAQIRATAAAYLARTRISMTSDKSQRALATWFKASADVRANGQLLG